MAQFTPDAGDIVWLQFDPQAGREQAGHRPALVLSPAAYNRKVGLMVCCPMTTHAKGYPFEVQVDGGVALVDQVNSLDWRERKAKRKGKATPAALAEAREKLIALIAG